jgi:WD40-like Beta Propeller Repeat
MKIFRIALFVLGYLFFNRTYGQAVVPQIFAPGVISGPIIDAAPVFSPDGKTVYFHRSGNSLGAVILVSHLQNGNWSTPVVAPFSGSWSDIEPAMAPDGSYLIFSSNRPASSGGKPLNGHWNGQHFPQSGGNLWRVNRKGNGWGEAVRLPDVINSDSSVFSPAVAASGNLYFMKPVGDTGKFHLYQSIFKNGTYQPPQPMPFSTADTISEVDAAIAPDESFMIICSRRSPATKMELFIVFQKDHQWGEPIQLGADMNRSWCNEARLSADHRTLYFTSGYTLPAATSPSDPATTSRLLLQSAWDTGAPNIWFIPLDKWLDNRN